MANLQLAEGFNAAHEASGCLRCKQATNAIITW